MGAALTAMSIIDARGITHTYGERRALDDFSLSIAGSGVFGLLGPNGSGKSTFITMLAAMETPSQGTLEVFGESPSARLRGRIGTVFQENALDPLMSVRESLHLAARLFGVRSSEIAGRTMELLEAFGLGERAKDPTSTLSGGMRRRLEMARALIHDPALLLLDEPTTGVDPDERKVLWEALLSRERGERTILLATNDLAEADTVCDAVAFIRDGHVVAEGTPDELKRGLRHEALRVTWDGPTDEQLAMVESWAGAGEVTQDGDVVHITVDDASVFVPRLFNLAPRAIRAVSIETSSLEDAYFQHVGRRRREPREATA
jgi:ABC-2 type transport system ATP-binding protein